MTLVRAVEKVSRFKLNVVFRCLFYILKSCSTAFNDYILYTIFFFSSNLNIVIEMLLKPVQTAVYAAYIQKLQMYNLKILSAALQYPHSELFT